METIKYLTIKYYNTEEPWRVAVWKHLSVTRMHLDT